MRQHDLYQQYQNELAHQQAYTQALSYRPPLLLDERKVVENPLAIKEETNQTLLLLEDV